MTTSNDASDGSAFDPNWVIEPGATIIECLHDEGIPNAVAAEFCDLTVEEFERLLVGHVRIDEPIAEGLENCIGASAQFWLNLEDNFRTGLARGKEWLRQ